MLPEFIDVFQGPQTEGCPLQCLSAYQLVCIIPAFIQLPMMRGQNRSPDDLFT